jgi:VanZ family protein
VEDVKRWLPVFLYAALIFYFSSTPGAEVPNWVSGWDKLAHAGEYAGFAFLLARAFGARRWWWAIIAAALYGVTDEYHQTFTADRFGNDPGDLIADAVGATLGAVAWQFVFTPLLRSRRGDGTNRP